MNTEQQDLTTTSTTNSSTTPTTTSATNLFHHGVPCGSYLSRITNCKHKVNSDTSSDVVRLDLEISSGEHQGHPLTKYYNMTSKPATDFFRKEMKEIGVPVDNREALAHLPGQLIGKEVMANVVLHTSGNQNVLLKNAVTKPKPVVVNPDQFWT